MRILNMATVALTVLALAGTAFAKGPMSKATGSISMGSPNQALSLSAFDDGPDSSLDKGTVEYSNFDYPTPGAPEYLHYSTPILCATVDATNMDARFMYQIPEGWLGLSGLYVVGSVHDGGTPGADLDTYGHAATADYNTAKAWCETGSGFTPSMYPVTAGNLVVHTH